MRRQILDQFSHEMISKVISGKFIKLWSHIVDEVLELPVTCEVIEELLEDKGSLLLTYQLTNI